MYESLLDTDPVKLYIKNNCDHLLSLEFSIDVFTSDKILTEYKDYYVKSSDRKNHPSTYTNKSGVYIFTCIDTGFQYVGSAICLNKRFKSHLINSVRVERGGNNPLYSAVQKLGWDRFIWKPFFITDNHMIKFLENNPGVELGYNSLYILRSFTQFEARSIEQAFLTKLRPMLNRMYTVNFPFVNWQKDNENYTDNDSVKLTVESKDRELNLTFPSKNRAAVSLGIPNTTLNRYINLKNFPVYSPILDRKIFLIDRTKPLSSDRPKFEDYKSISPISDVDLYALDKGKLFALNLDKETLYGIYDNPSHAALTLDNKSDNKYIRRYINLERPVIVGSNKDSVYFVMNPDWKNDIIGRIADRPGGRKKSSLSKSIVLVDVKKQHIFII